MSAATGAPYWAYGGDFGEKQHDGAFCNNGIVFPDRTLHPGYHEVAYHYQKIHTWLAQPARPEVGVRNRFAFLDLRGIVADWCLLADGRVVAAGDLPLPPLGPGQEARVAVPLPVVDLKPGTERHLSIRYRLAADSPWAPAGHIVAREQLELSPVPLRAGSTPNAVPTTAGAVVVQEAPDRLDLTAAAGTARVSLRDGALSAYSVSGRELIAAPLHHHFYRAPTDNDRGGRYPDAWREHGLDRLAPTTRDLLGYALPNGEAQVRVRQFYAAADVDYGFETETLMTVSRDGSLGVDLTVVVDPRVQLIPRIGIQWGMPGCYEQCTWFGRGPHENYCDRKASAFVAIHALPVDQLYTPYIVPGENGGRCDVRWFALRDATGAGLRVSGDVWFQFSAHRCTAADLATAKHTPDLPRRETVTVCLDHRHMGVGGDTGWTPSVYEPYLIRPGHFRYRIRLTPLAPGAELG